MSAFYVVYLVFVSSAAAHLAPCVLPLSSLFFPSRFFVSLHRGCFSFPLQLVDLHRNGSQSLPGHPAFFCMRFEDDRFPSAPGVGRCEPRPLCPPLSLPPACFFFCLRCHALPQGLSPIQASETLVCGAASRPPALPLRPTHLYLLFFCRGSGLRGHAVPRACRVTAF
jgi:hypothetical protein